MTLKNTQHSFGIITKALHWTSALIVLVLLVVGFLMGDMAFSPAKMQIYTLHKSFGMTLLGLVLIRLTWHATTKTPKALPTHTKIEHILAKAVHIILYVSMIAMPLSGWIMSNAGEYANSYFGLFEWPHLVGKDETLYRKAKDAHEIFAFTFIGAIGLHALGALKHHLIDKDETLKRMGGNFLIALVGIALLLSAAFLGAKDIFSRQGKTQKETFETLKNIEKTTASAQQEPTAPHWIIDPKTSRIDFTFLQYGTETNGTFDTWSGDIFFDSNNLVNSSVDILINTASINTGSPDRNEQAKDDEWFAVQNHPQATFKSINFTKQDEKNYSVNGTLTLHGITQAISFPFTLDIDESHTPPRASMSGALTLDRTLFDIGSGQWESADTIAHEVTISLSVNANKATP